MAQDGVLFYGHPQSTQTTLKQALTTTSCSTHLGMPPKDTVAAANFTLRIAIRRYSCGRLRKVFRAESEAQVRARIAAFCGGRLLPALEQAQYLVY